jgi:hypothetical protein
MERETETQPSIEDRVAERLGIADEDNAADEGASPEVETEVASESADEPTEEKRTPAPERNEQPRTPGINPDALWTEADVQARVKYETALEKLNSDIAEWNQAAALVGQIADPTARADYEQRLMMAHEKITRGSEALGRMANEIEQGLRTRAQTQMREFVANEGKKLMPGFDRAKVRDYLLKQGVSEQAIDSPTLSAFELNTAFKAMLYDELQATKAQRSPTKRVKVTKNIPSIERDLRNPEAAQARLEKYHRPADVERVLTIRELKRPKATGGHAGDRGGESLSQMIRDYQSKDHKRGGS